MRQIALFIAAALATVSVAGCAVEVPMSAFQVGPLGTEKAPALAPQPEHGEPGTR